MVKNRTRSKEAYLTLGTASDLERRPRSLEMDEQVNPLERDHSLSVLLPGGLEKNATVHGSKPVMDLLVILCASYHLNPADYTVEVLSPNKNNISFKPNSPIGSLEAETIVLKPKGMEEKIRRPYMPEASVRLLINYNKSHKAVVRVNPRVPLELLLPVVCDKCEFRVETTVLLRDSRSKEPLDLTKTLNDHGLREVFAKDTAGKEPVDHRQQPTEVTTPPPLQGLPKTGKQPKENTGFLSLFRRRKKKPEMEGAVSAPASPGLNKQAGVGMNGQGASSSDTLPADMTKKRRAPQPPLGASQSIPNNLSSCHLRRPQRSAELRSTKRRAPPPPCASSHQQLQADTEVKGTVGSLNTVEELRESDESDPVNPSPSSASSPHPSQPRPSSSSRPSFAYLHGVVDPYRPSFRGKDLSDARCALAKVLTSSVSKGTLVKRLRNSATFPRFYNGTSVTRRCSDNGVFCAELESVLTPDLPTEPDWEEPLQRKGMTTFKVVPSKKLKPRDAELTLDVSDQITVEDNPESDASPEVGKPPTETEEGPRSPDGSETETPSPSPVPSSQESRASDSTSLPPPLDLDSPDCPGSPLSEVGGTIENQEEEEEPEATCEVKLAAPSDCSDGELPTNGQIDSEDQREFLQSPSGQSVSTDTDEKEVEEEVVQEEEEEEEEEDEVDSFPPPPPPVFFNEDLEVVEEGIEAATSSSQPQSPTSNGRANAFSEDRQNEPPSAMPDRSAAAPTPLNNTSAAPSRFAQAVALAVQRSRLQSLGKGLGPQAPSGPHSTLPSPPRSAYQYGA